MRRLCLLTILPLLGGLASAQTTDPVLVRLDPGNVTLPPRAKVDEKDVRKTIEAAILEGLDEDGLQMSGGDAPLTMTYAVRFETGREQVGFATHEEQIFTDQDLVNTTTMGSESTETFRWQNMFVLMEVVSKDSGQVEWMGTCIVPSKGRKPTLKKIEACVEGTVSLGVPKIKEITR